MDTTGEDVIGEKVKIAILGGGMSGLTAAFELTRTPELRAKYEVTVYQMGWRLGGKCATGRGPNGRIEEHGIHGFSGSYYNAFGLMNDCYQELPEATCVDGKNSVGVLKSFNDAFHGVDEVIMWEVENGKLHSWPFYVGPNKMSPFRYYVGPKKGSPLKYEESMKLIQDFIKRGAALMGPSFELGGPPGPEQEAIVAREGVMGWMARKWSWLVALVAFIGLIHKMGLLLSLVKTLFKWFNPGSGKGAMPHRIHRLSLFVNFFKAMKDGIFDRKTNILANGFDAIDDQDYRQWLSDHGANNETLDSSLSYNTIDLSYSYPLGDTALPPSMGAGTYLHWTLRMFLSLGCFIWSFEAGTGETVIAPLYHVLKHRGVRFKFFHKVTNLILSDDRRSVSAVEFDRQVTLKAPDGEYDPLILVKDLLCWPSNPKYELIEEGDQLRAEEIDLECYWSEWNNGSDSRKMTIAAGQEFHKVIFAISVGAVKYLCKDIINEPSERGGQWRNMIDYVKTCPTQTMQIWLTRESGKLGSAEVAGAGDEADLPVLSGTFVQPFNGQVDFSNLLKHEDWKNIPKEGKPRSLWYFSGAMADEPSDDLKDHGFPDRQRDRVRYQSIQFLQATTGYLLPWSNAAWSPMALDFSILYADDPAAKGMDKFESQFWRANIDPTERYVLAPAGSTRHRLEADGAGFDNLVLAGDWIYNGLNVGSFEGAVMGGKLAAHAISGSPDLETVYGYRRRRQPAPDLGAVSGSEGAAEPRAIH